jgi:hypothetical protein
VNEFTSLRKASGVVAPAPKLANLETKEPKTRAIKGGTVPAPTAATPPIRSSSASVVLMKVKILCFRSVVVLVLRGSASTHQIALQSGTATFTAIDACGIAIGDDMRILGGL